MRSQLLRVAAGITVVVAASGCSRGVPVRTIVAPQAFLSELHSYNILPVPPRRDGRPAAGAYDPMVNNSITNRALRESIAATLDARGYAFEEETPDFAIAFYASAREKLDVTAWDYGYPYWPPWRRPVPPAQTVTRYTEGMVVIDVLNAKSRDLLWRGEGTAVLTNDPADDAKLLQDVAVAIVNKFPRATRRALALSP